MKVGSWKLEVGTLRVFCFVSLSILYLLASSFYFPVHAQPIDPYTIGKRVFKDPPALLVAQPQNNTTIFGHNVTVKMVVDNIILTNFERIKRNQTGEGHLHLWLDITPLTAESAIQYSSVDDYIFTNVPSGQHTLAVEVVQNDHRSFQPRIMQFVAFETIAAPAALASPSGMIQKQEMNRPVFMDASTTIRIGLLTAALVFIGLGVLLWFYR